MFSTSCFHPKPNMDIIFDTGIIILDSLKRLHLFNESKIMIPVSKIMSMFGFRWKQDVENMLIVSFDTEKQLIISLPEEFVN